MAIHRKDLGFCTFLIIENMYIINGGHGYTALFYAVLALIMVFIPNPPKNE